MATTLTSKGQVTIPKRIRDALSLQPGSSIEFTVNQGGELVLQHAKSGRRSKSPPKDRFDVVRGSADIRWRTDDLMKLLRADD